MRWASGDGVSPSKARSRRTGPGSVRYGAVGRSGAGRGKGCDGSTEGLRAFPAAFIGGQATLWLGVARRGAARCGAARRDLARVTDGGTEAPASLPPSQGVGKARRSGVRCGGASPCEAWPGLARVADSSKELLRRLPAALF
jgi:hypothetical protein